MHFFSFLFFSEFIFVSLIITKLIYIMYVYTRQQMYAYLYNILHRYLYLLCNINVIFITRARARYCSRRWRFCNNTYIRFHLSIYTIIIIYNHHWIIIIIIFVRWIWVLRQPSHVLYLLYIIYYCCARAVMKVSVNNQFVRSILC